MLTGVSKTKQNRLGFCVYIAIRETGFVLNIHKESARI